MKSFHTSYQTSDYRKTFKGHGKCRYISCYLYCKQDVTKNNAWLVSQESVNFLYEKGQSLSRQYFITIWWFPQVLSPNHRLVFIAKSNVFLSWTIWCLKHQLHDHSLACSWNGSQSSHDNGWPFFFRQLLRITKAVVNQFVNFNPRKIRELMIFFGISRLILHVKQKPF